MNRLPAVLAAIAITGLGVARDGLAQDTRYLAANCANCHGTDGRGDGVIPRLAGVSASYIVEQMQAFRNGRRQATVMHQLAKGYSDAQVSALADYFSRQPR